MIHKAKDLSLDEKRAVEALLGRALSEEEEISIRALPAPEGLSPERRKQIVAALEAHFAKVNAQRQPLSGEQADDIINEALRSTRAQYRFTRP